MKRKILGTLFIAASLCITACGSSVPEISEEQNAQIVEYAAGLLLKYDENYHSRLVEEEIENAGEESEETKEAEKTVKEEETTQSQAEESSEDTTIVNKSETVETAAYSSIEEFYGIDGVTITYSGYELKDMYPEINTEDMFFAMSATKGRKLMVLNFDVANVSGSDIKLDMLSLNTKFKISVNGESRYALTTMLTDDLSSFAGTIAADSAQKLVLIGEIPEENVDSIQSLALIMKNVSEDATIPLN